MRLIYNPDFTAFALPRPVAIANAGTAQVYYPSAPSVNAVALIGCTMASCSVDSSIDGETWTSRASSLVPTPSGLIATFATVTGAKYWRVTNNGAAGTYQLLYAGMLIETRNPTYPFRFESDVVADDRMTLGGAGYSKVFYAARTGEWQFVLDDTDNAKFRAAYAATKGFRSGVVVEIPISNEVVPIRAPGSYPFSLQEFGKWSGKMNLVEIL